MSLKEKVGELLATRVQDGQVIGVGTGSTVDAALAAIGRRVKDEQLHVQVIPTSRQSAWRCFEEGLVVLDAAYSGHLHWSFDGADAVNDRCWLVKGHGGAALLEKILAARSREYVIIVDESKLYENIADCSVPIEVLPEARGFVEERLASFEPKSITLRAAKAKHGPVITEKGNILFDVQFSSIAEGLEQELKQIVGVVETGLFTNYATEVLVARESGIESLFPPK